MGVGNTIKHKYTEVENNKLRSREIDERQSLCEGLTVYSAHIHTTVLGGGHRILAGVDVLMSFHFTVHITPVSSSGMSCVHSNC